MVAAARRVTGQMVGYVRVSSVDQNEARQLEGVALDKTFTDKVSGKDTNRPQLQRALEYLREGDTLVIHSMDRLARNMLDLERLVNNLTDKGITVEFKKEKLVFAKPIGDTESLDFITKKLMLRILGSIGEFERQVIRERQREGIAIAKTKGVYKGRKPSLTLEQATLVRKRAEDGENKAALAREFGISRAALYTYLTATEPRTIHPSSA